MSQISGGPGSKDGQVREIIKCGNDPAYFFRKYCKIQHPIKGTIPFVPYDFQNKCVENFTEHRFNIVLKSRQLGLSTLVAAYATWLALFYKDQNILIIATKQKVAYNLMRKIKFMVSNVPSWLLLTREVANNKQEIEFSNGSIIKAVPTSPDAGRSEAISLLIVDECAFIQGFDELWTGIYPTLSTGGRAIIFSTPYGVGGTYYDLYIKAELGLNEFFPIKLPWNVHPERDEAWFENECRNLSNDKRRVSQELLCDFAASGDTFMGAEELESLGKLIRPPHEKKGEDRNCWVWAQPVPGHTYIMSADVARGDSKDYSTFHVIDVQEGEIAAEYKGRMFPDKFAAFLVEIGLLYNTAVICPENNSIGLAVVLEIRRLGYPRMYYQDSNRANIFIDYAPPEEPSKAGIRTDQKTRPAMLAKLEEVLRNKQLKNYSSRLYEELKTFVWSGPKPQAMKGHNDDLVMSIAIGVWLFDASAEYSQQSHMIAAAMFNSMGVNRKTYSTPAQTVTSWDKAIDMTGDAPYLDNKRRRNPASVWDWLK